MEGFRRNLRVPSALVALAFLMLLACGKVTYKLPDEFLSDGELLTASMEAAAAEMGENRLLKPENQPFVLERLADEEEEHAWLYDRFEDVVAAELSSRGLELAPEATEEETVIKYRLVESRVVNAKAEGGRVKRIGRTIAHVRFYGAGGELFWAGEYEGEFENVVPKNVVSKLRDDRIEQIGPQLPEAGQNPFVEPLLVTGITGALIYLFAVSASAE
jgi:hypothetical protein